MRTKCDIFRLLVIAMMTNYFAVLAVHAANQEHDERTFFYGSHADHLDQWSAVLRLKAIVKAKAFDCKRLHYCMKGFAKRFLFNSTPKLDALMRYLSDHHRGVIGAFATGWLRNDCDVAFPLCDSQNTVVINEVPCKPSEACFREELQEAPPLPTTEATPSVTAVTEEQQQQQQQVTTLSESAIAVVK